MSCEGASINCLIIFGQYLWTGANIGAYNHLWWQVALQLTPSELLGFMDAQPPSVGNVVTCDESLSVILSHILHFDLVRT